MYNILKLLVLVLHTFLLQKKSQSKRLCLQCQPWAHNRPVQRTKLVPQIDNKAALLWARDLFVRIVTLSTIGTIMVWFVMYPYI